MQALGLLIVNLFFTQKVKDAFIVAGRGVF